MAGWSTLDGAKTEGVETGPSDFFLATGADARRAHGEFAELRAQRFNSVGAAVIGKACDYV